jgi:hypothetical protein
MCFSRVVETSVGFDWSTYVWGVNSILSIDVLSPSTRNFDEYRVVEMCPMSRKWVFDRKQCSSARNSMGIEGLETETERTKNVYIKLSTTRRGHRMLLCVYLGNLSILICISFWNTVKKKRKLMDIFNFLFEFEISLFPLCVMTIILINNYRIDTTALPYSLKNRTHIDAFARHSRCHSCSTFIRVVPNTAVSLMPN